MRDARARKNATRTVKMAFDIRGPSVHAVRENFTLYWRNRLRIKRNDSRRMYILNELVLYSIPNNFRKMTWHEYLIDGIKDAHDKFYSRAVEIGFLSPNSSCRSLTTKLQSLDLETPKEA